MSAKLATVRDLLLRRPSLIDARAASIRLLTAREKCSAAEASELLDALKTANSIADLFRAVMPQEFKKDRGSRAGIAKRFAAALGFPVSLYEIEGVLASGDDLIDEGIPIAGMNGHLCANCYDFASLPPLFQLASLLFESRDELDLGLDDPEDFARYTEELEERWKLFAKAHKLPDSLKPDAPAGKLYKAFASERSPLRFLPTFVRMIAYNTGSIFFDFDPNDDAPEIEWTRESITWLRKEYQRAQQIERDLNTLENWFDEDPPARILRALKIARNVNNGQRKPRLANAKGRSLVRIL